MASTSPNMIPLVESKIAGSTTVREIPNQATSSSQSSKTFATVGLVLSWTIGVICLILGAYTLYLGEPHIYLQGYSKHIVPLLINFLVTICSDSAGFIHSVTLRWALLQEERLVYNSNIRLLTRSKTSKPNGWLANALVLFCMTISFSSPSLIFLSVSSSFGSGGNAGVVHISGFAILGLGVGLTGQAAIATWALFSSKPRFWSSNALLTAFTCSEMGMARVPGRCMFDISQYKLETRAVRPRAKQPSAFSAIKTVRWICLYLLLLPILCLIWAVAVKLACVEGSNNSETGWTFTNGADANEQIDPLFGLVWSFFLVSLIQAIMTLGLHCAELIVNLSRDESAWRSATSKKGANLYSNSIVSAMTSWQNIGLFIFKPIVHWQFGLGMSVHWQTGVEWTPHPVFILTLIAALLFFFGILIAVHQYSGPQPAAYGHLPTLINLIDNWSAVLFWGHKSDGAICHAGTSPRSLPKIKADYLYQ